MFEDMFHFLEPVLTVFTAIAVVTLAAVVCIGCIALAFKVGDSFKGMLRKRYAYCRDKWKLRVYKIADYVGNKIGKTISTHLDKIYNLPTENSSVSDLRYKMVGKWITENDDEMVISEEDGLYLMSIRIRDVRMTENYLIGLTTLPNNRQNLFIAEGSIPMTIGFSDNHDIIYIPDNNRKFHRTYQKLPSEIQAEIDACFREPTVFPVEEELSPRIVITDELRDKLARLDDESGFQELDASVNRNIIE